MKSQSSKTRYGDIKMFLIVLFCITLASNHLLAHHWQVRNLGLLYWHSIWANHPAFVDRYRYRCPRRIPKAAAAYGAMDSIIQRVSPAKAVAYGTEIIHHEIFDYHGLVFGTSEKEVQETLDTPKDFFGIELNWTSQDGKFYWWASREQFNGLEIIKGIPSTSPMMHGFISI